MSFEPYVYPDKNERSEILKSQPLFSSLYLISKNVDKTVDTFEDFIKENDFTIWRNRFNNKVGKLEFSYVLLRFYYSRGIPDTHWVEITDEGTTEFFPLLKDKEVKTNKFLFNYSVENFFYHYVSAMDLVYHILNIYFKLSVKSGTGFNRKVLNKLKEHPIAKTIEDFETNMLRFRKERNDFAHNFSPTEIDIRSKWEIKENREVITMGNYSYSTSSETLERIEDSIVHFSKLMKSINSELKQVP